MKVGLYNLEPNIVNIALMQVSTYYKDKGDEVEMYNPLFHETYDKIYAFSLFKFTPKVYIRKNMVCGGTGFDIKSRLPKNIEECDYDWSMFPNCDFSILRFSMGCIRDCPFCVVRAKEGFIYPVKHKNLNPGGKEVHVYDNNFFANPKWKESIKILKKIGQPVNFAAGLDVRIFNDTQGKALKEIKLTKYIHIAWDNPKEKVIPQLNKFIKYVKPYKIICYVLIGYWSTPEEDLMRIKELMKLGITPFVMPFKKDDPYQKDFARWCNRPELRKTCEWEDYKKAEKHEEWKIENKKPDDIKEKSLIEVFK